MFTGLVEEVGVVQSLSKKDNSTVITIHCKDILDQTTKVGDSIAVNGVCLTVTSLGNDYFTADVMNETLSRSSLQSQKKGSIVNLERAMAADGRFGGHIVSGHIDGTGTIEDIVADANAIWYTIKADEEFLKYIVEKGSIAIDGISLTVASVNEDSFKVSTIPHTREVTNLGSQKVGNTVNLECDVLGKYVERLLNFKQKPKAKKDITLSFLAENGFI